MYKHKNILHIFYDKSIIDSANGFDNGKLPKTNIINWG